MIPVHVVTGFLGAGKTTLLLSELAARDGSERCAVIVNDFGLARFDAARFEGKALVRDIPGGCVCCTAPEDLAPTVGALLATGGVDRIFIEATGLARPADIVDTLRRTLASAVEVAPVTAVVDPDRWAADRPALLEEQLQAADVLVLSHLDRAKPQAVADLKAWAAERHPPLLKVIDAEGGRVPDGTFEARYRGLALWRPSGATAPSTAGWSTASRQWGPERIFDMGALRALLEASSAERVKGLFRTDLGWYRLERAGGALDRSPTPFHSASRVDVILHGPQGDADALADALGEAVYTPPPAGTVPQVQLVRADGEATPLDRAMLLSLDGQVADVGQIAPGREGAGVWLREVLALAAPPPGSRFVVAAGDGMTTDPVPVAGAGDAVLVHSLGGDAFPADQGGPFRVYVPKEAGRSACANVKKVVRVVIEAG